MYLVCSLCKRFIKYRADRIPSTFGSGINGSISSFRALNETVMIFFSNSSINLAWLIRLLARSPLGKMPRCSVAPYLPFQVKQVAALDPVFPLPEKQCMHFTCEQIGQAKAFLHKKKKGGAIAFSSVKKTPGG